MKFTTKLAAAAVALGLASQAQAATVFKSEDTQVDIYGYVKVDLRHVNGDIAYRDFWIGNIPPGSGPDADIGETRFVVEESRLGFKINHDNVLAVLEMDFYGGGGNEIISNSSNPRIRNLYIKTGNWLVGQNWSTFMPLHTLAETLDFGGAHVGESFLRQGQIRYTTGNFSFALENPETLSGSGSSDESLVDFIGRYDTKGDWGQLSASVLVRKVDQSGIDETGVGANVAAKFNVGAKDDFKLAVTFGEYGRYAGTVAVPGVANRGTPTNPDIDVEEGLSVSTSYRHWWTDSLRTTVFYGQSTTDIGERDRSHWGVNLINQHSAKLKYGVEVGQYIIEDEVRIFDTVTDELASVTELDLDSTYLQVSAQYSF